MICLAIPVMMAAKQLKLTSPNASTIRPCAVSGLAESDRPPTIEGQLHLSWDSKPPPVESLEANEIFIRQTQTGHSVSR